MIPSDIVNDAHLIADYGTRAGKLDTNDLLDAIANTNLVGEGLTLASPEIASLRRAINAAIPKLAPVTLLDLKSGFNPFDTASSTASWWPDLRIGLIGLAIYLLIFGAYYTMWQEKASDVLRELAENKKVQQAILINQLLPVMSQFDASGTTFGELDDPAGLMRTSFRDRIYEARLLTNQIVGDNLRLIELQRDRFPLWTFLKRNATPEAPPQVSPDTPPQFGPELPPLPAPLSGLVPYRDCFLNRAPEFSAMASENLTLADYPSAYYFAALVKRDDSLLQTVRCLIGLSAIESRALAQDPNYAALDEQKLKNQLEIMTTWLLPTAYGMLGAVIFHLRVCLNPMRPNQGRIQVTLRIFLGGFAGVAVSWFLRPENGEFAFSNLSIGVLTLAFIVGFGIDIFFTMLDRWVTILTNAAENMGSQQKPAPMPTS